VPSGAQLCAAEAGEGQIRSRGTVLRPPRRRQRGFSPDGFTRLK
jgi:hypothetical protein